MAMESGFFNSKNGDRKYNARDISRYFEHVLSSGLFKNITDCMKVSAAGGMALTVSPGAGMIDGQWFRQETPETLTIGTANAALPRFDTVVVRLDLSDNVRAVTLDVVPGTPAASPVETAPVRTETIYELVLALVYVPAGTAEIVAENITDVRGNEWYCDYVHSLTEAPVLKRLGGTFRTSVNDTSIIPINVAAFEPELDIVNVYVNGFHMTQGIDYTVDKANKTIILTYGVDRNTIVAFEVYKATRPDDIPTTSETVSALLDEVTALKSALSDEAAERADAFAQVAPIGPGVFAFEGAQIVSGFVSSTSQRLYFSIPFNRLIDATGFTVRSMNLQVRQNGKYILGSANTWYDISSDIFTATISKNGMLMISCEPTFTETPANNMECGIHIEATAEIEFT